MARAERERTRNAVANAGPEPRRRIPSVDALLRSEPGRRASGTFGRPLVKHALSITLEQVREAAERGTGARERRSTRAERLLTSMTGAEDALVVNNGAAALLLALASLARGKG